MGQMQQRMSPGVDVRMPLCREVFDLNDKKVPDICRFGWTMLQAEAAHGQRPQLESCDVFKKQNQSGWNPEWRGAEGEAKVDEGQTPYAL